MVRSSQAHAARSMVVAVIAVCLGWTATVRACPMCASNLPGGDGPAAVGDAPDAGPASGDAMQSSAGQGDLARGFYLSILLMLAVPYTMLVSGGAVLWWHFRRAGEVVIPLSDAAATPAAVDHSSQTA